MHAAPSQSTLVGTPPSREDTKLLHPEGNSHSAEHASVQDLRIRDTAKTTMTAESPRQTLSGWDRGHPHTLAKPYSAAPVVLDACGLRAWISADTMYCSAPGIQSF